MTIEITGNETLDELEAILDSVDDAEVVDEPLLAAPEPVIAEVASTESAVPPLDGDTNVAPPTTDDVIVEQSEEQPEKKVIVAKDGEHIIPYDVLEAERRESERLRQQIADMKQKQPEYDQQSRLLELRDKQLQKLGVDLDDLPENLTVNDKQIDDLRENYPELAPFITSLMAKIDAVTANTAPVTDVSTNNPVLDDIKSNTDLNGWMGEKGDKWALALDIDDRLLADPTWSEKPQRERFEEVVRRTKAAFGETLSTFDPVPEVKPVLEPAVDDTQVREVAEQKEKAAAESLPESPSLVGASNQHQGTVLQQAVNMNNAELQNLMSTMTPDQIDALLDQADY
ncbi:hypothetical protein CTM97_19350 [Photobacterium phosphoreum]|uniref:Uncharacterized protein n=1 Tax=Photobacterium phosphoreum TaxID=659 RepID=A0A2T3JQ20_PHOPO|nr:hypothetical protein [Photobacterium phosphoreum]PSU24688.1 hypothetical protein CTM96_12165 [Photobacterium phosphoreum]PSU38248.1 hypothetical protein CTM97_19350 [Photobacterium phosphoreum]PSU51138.1 hypothetical protein C9J18_13165 [Photobacterium phosphoreum]